MARPTKFTKEIGDQIIAHLRNGHSRRAAAEALGIHYNTLLNWLSLASNPETAGDLLVEFAEGASRAEALIEQDLTDILITAAKGYDTKRMVKTSKTVIKMKKEFFPDGRRIETPVAIQEVTTQVMVGHEFNPDLAFKVLGRRRYADWGERKQIDIKTLTNEQIIALLEEDAGADSGGEGTALLGAG